MGEGGGGDLSDIDDAQGLRAAESRVDHMEIIYIYVVLVSG